MSYTCWATLRCHPQLSAFYCAWSQAMLMVFKVWRPHVGSRVVRIGPTPSPGLIFLLTTGKRFFACLLCFWCFVSVVLVVSTSAMDCFGRFNSEKTYYVLSGTLNLTYSLKFWCILSVQFYLVLPGFNLVWFTCQYIAVLVCCHLSYAKHTLTILIFFARW